MKHHQAALPFHIIFTNMVTRIHMTDLHKHARSCDTADILHSAIGLTDLAMTLRKNGYKPYAEHRDGLYSTPVSHDETYTRFCRTYGRQQQDGQTLTAIEPEALRALSNIQRHIHTKDPHAATGFAIAFASACAEKIQDCSDEHPGSFARLVFTKHQTKDKPRIVVTGHPFNLGDTEKRPARSSPIRGIVCR